MDVDVIMLYIKDGKEKITILCVDCACTESTTCGLKKYLCRNRYENLPVRNINERGAVSKV
jgi:hypothetical protein